MESVFLNIFYSIYTYILNYIKTCRYMLITYFCIALFSRLKWCLLLFKYPCTLFYHRRSLNFFSTHWSGDNYTFIFFFYLAIPQWEHFLISSAAWHIMNAIFQTEDEISITNRVLQIQTRWHGARVIIKTRPGAMNNSIPHTIMDVITHPYWGKS